MTFEALHPAIQHHIVNSLEWRTLRPLQEAAVEPILAGHHALLLAPTAGGKTEAAMFPLFSRMLSESWTPLSLIYVCPLRALLNNLEVRLSRFGGLLGRSVALWHGDVPDSVRRRIRSDPPDVLLTTPESLEVMLVTRSGDREALFGNLRAVVVDELHAFAGDDRGWHLLSVLERVSRIAGRDLQRVGLSATVGNPEGLLEWLAGSSPAIRRVVGRSTHAEAEVKIDAVGSVENAALVLSRLYRGEKRLVFADSRSRVEELAFRLRELGVETYVSHGSLGVDERREAEKAFAERSDCIIVATSTLELGIDVGDLDRVVQIDAPGRVSSFLQRLGRTGRRPDMSRNLLFLTTDDDALLLASALVALWRRGYVEDVWPPATPYHVLAQQLLALTFQLGGWEPPTWRNWLGGIPQFASLGAAAQSILEHMFASGLLFADQGLAGLGPEGDRRFAGQRFLDLLSVFWSEPLVTVLHGRTEIGRVDEASFQLKQEEGTPVLLLGGRPWAVKQVDWKERLAWVEPIQIKGRSLWPGSGQSLSFEVCRAMRDVLRGLDLDSHLTQRACEALGHLRDEFAWLPERGTALVRGKGGRTRWWTFGGLKANATLADFLAGNGIAVSGRTNLALTLAEDAPFEDLRRLGHEAAATARSLTPTSLAAESARNVKFAECVPSELLIGMLRSRLADPRATAEVSSEAITDVALDSA